MKIIPAAPNPSGAFPAIQEVGFPSVPVGMAIWPDALDTADFYAHNGFVTLTVEPINGVDTVTGYTPNIEAWEAWVSTQPPAPDPLESAKEAKLEEISAACRKAIVTGCDVTLSTGATEHFSLEETDQINLTAAATAVSQGSTAYPYHADGQLCRLYPAADILAISQAAIAHKLYQTTYCNHIMTWVRRAASVEELDSITYASKLPDDLAANMAAILAAASNV